MQKLISLIGLFFTLLLSFFSFQYRLPDTETIHTPQLKSKGNILLLPLDSRPVCTDLAQQLAHLAGTNLILPPKAILDNYENKALRPKLLDYLQRTLPTVNEAFFSTDLLIHGGLLASRQLAQDEFYEEEFFRTITRLQQEEQNKNLTMFTIIPRLLVSDQLIPDRWYSYYLLRYSQYYDLYAATGDRFAVNYVGEYARKIPLEILTKYLELYRQNECLGLKLMERSGPQLRLVIGQDDSSTYGLPQTASKRLQGAAQGRTSVSFTQGADEIAALLVARSYLEKSGYKPKLAVIYADSSIKDLTMPYQSLSCQELVKDKCQLLGVSLTAEPAQADIVLYLNCGHDGYQPQTKQTAELQRLMKQYPHVALLDLTANFQEDELLMPLLLTSRTPLNKLTGYAGWNTFSNSLGTVLAQSVIFTGRKQELKDEQELIALYAANIKYNTERILEDYYYQKLLHSQLSWEVNSLGYDARHMYWTILKYAEQRTNFCLRLAAQELLHNCLGQEPFYQNYFLQAINVNSSFPWRRTFETKLAINVEFGKKL